MTFSIVVSTFGDEEWEELALSRALPSAVRQSVPANVVYNHGKSLHEARNKGAEEATGDFLIFLDADDELDRDYVKAMTQAVEEHGPMMLIRPATFGIREDGVEDAHPVVLPQRDLLQQNFMVIGTVVARELFLKAGGFRNWPLYEDWDLWLRCWLAGAEFAAQPEAIYRVHVRSGSRNQPSEREKVATYTAIRKQYTGSGRRRRPR